MQAFDRHMNSANMDALDAKPHSIDFAVQITHDPLRVYVMGERVGAALKAEVAKLKSE